MRLSRNRARARNRPHQEKENGRLRLFYSVRLRSQMLLYATVRKCARPFVAKSVRKYAAEPFHIGAYPRAYLHNPSVQPSVHSKNLGKQCAPIRPPNWHGYCTLSCLSGSSHRHRPTALTPSSSMVNALMWLSRQHQTGR